MAGVQMVIYEADGLQEDVADGCAEEFEATSVHVPADCIRDGW